MMAEPYLANKNLLDNLCYNKIYFRNADIKGAGFGSYDKNQEGQ